MGRPVAAESRIGLAFALMLSLFLPSAVLAQSAPVQPAQVQSASPGKSGGEGGGQGVNVTLHEATKANPILQTTVGQPKGPPSGNDPASRCLRLAWTDLTDLPDAPTQIVDASVRPARADAPAGCIVNGYIASQVAFRMWLPLEAAWNGKYMGTGCGGRCGELLPGACEFQFTRGYACMANDLGHRSTTYDDVWAIDNIPAQIDFGFRATHVATLVGKKITQVFYGRPPRYSYFVGASTGGRQGLIEAQRFPSDFNGVVSGEPAVQPPPTGLNAEHMLGGEGLFVDGRSKLSTDEIRMVHQAVLNRCDGQDGVRDGIVQDPRACAFRPSQLLCNGAEGAGCLQPDQVAALERVYASGPLPGSELGWIGAYVAADGTPGRYIRHPARTNTYPYAWVFDYALNPDLRSLKAAGAKLILYQGWADEVIPPKVVVDYAETVERVVGGRSATQDFFRFFVIPGQSHIPGNIGAESIDYVQAMEVWVENGRAPDVLIGRKLKSIKQMMGPMYLDSDLKVPSNWLYSRPVYPYPIQAHYKGRGDPDNADSFGPWDAATHRFIGR